MATDKQRGGSATGRDDSSGAGKKAGVGKQGQGGDSSRNDQGRSGSAQPEQGGSLSQQGGTSGRDSDEERVIRSGSSPRSRGDVPDEGKGGGS